MQQQEVDQSRVALKGEDSAAPLAEWLAKLGRTGATRRFYLILYPKELEDQVIKTLETCGVPGYTELPKLIGRGRRIRHFDNPVWPGATGAVFTVISPEQAEALVEPFERLNRELDTRSHGLYGLHMFAMPCEQVI